MKRNLNTSRNAACCDFSDHVVPGVSNVDAAIRSSKYPLRELEPGLYPRTVHIPSLMKHSRNGCYVHCLSLDACTQYESDAQSERSHPERATVEMTTPKSLGVIRK